MAAARKAAKKIAEETMVCLREGFYLTDEGQRVELAPLVESCVSKTIHIGPEEAVHLAHLPRNHAGKPCKVSVVPHTSLEAAQSLLRNDPAAKVAVLNFASAKNPGGGFLSGSIAQEECLARVSALYPCLQRFRLLPNHMYRINRSLKGTDRFLYTDAALFSPDVPVFRKESIDGGFIDKPYLVSFVSIPAPNAGAHMDALVRAGSDPSTPAVEEKLRTALTRRINRALDIAAANGCEVLVLGAFGCGVFRNNPSVVAAVFKEALASHDGFFSEVVFAVFVPPKKSPLQDANFVHFHRTLDSSHQAQPPRAEAK